VFLLDWGVRALSFFNTIALLWLGLTVLLTAEQRRWGTWVAGGGLVLGGLFFAGHTTVVSREFGTFDAEMEFWWRLGWIPFVSPPYIWYVIMAWYAAVLRTSLHRVALIALGILGILALGLIFYVSPLPTYSQLLARRAVPQVELGGVPLVVVLYPAYSALCISLSLAALRRPAATQRFMGDLARQRARPWLIAASGVLLVVSLLVGAMAAWIVRSVQAGDLVLFSVPTVLLLKMFDFSIAGLLALAIVLVGRAIVSYEVFTGKALPRGGLYRQWRNSLILAASFGLLMGVTFDLALDPSYRVLLATVLITVLYALHSWRVYADREASMARLRPFVASARMYERLLAGDTRSDEPTADAAAPFHALCRDVLGARVAYLVALGPLAPLAGPPLAYPAGTAPPVLVAPLLSNLVAGLWSPQTMCVAVEPASFAGAVWAVPLWSERGLVGILLLGTKVDEALYTQEEMEIARATGERLIDSQASAEMARRLMALQRQRLGESQIVDGRARRALHDEILPRLHAALLTLGAATPRSRARGANRAPEVELAAGPVAEATAQIADAHREIASLLRAMPPSTAPQIARLGLIGALRQTVDGELAGSFESVTWDVAPEVEQTTRGIAALPAEVLFGAAREAVRNAARYGRNGDPRQPLHLTVTARWRAEGLEIAVEDDGVGIAARPSAADILTDGEDRHEAGSGQGLGLHSTMMAVIGGTLTAESAPGNGTRVTLALPLGPQLASEPPVAD
jgi:signal transduction histidine kinase